MRSLIVFASFFLSGCASGPPAPYADAGLYWLVDPWTDPLLRTEQTWTCENPQFIASLGVEFDHKISCSLQHFSGLLCGRPFGPKPEVYYNAIGCKKKWWGR